MKRLRFNSDYDPEVIQGYFSTPSKDKILSSRHREIRERNRFAKVTRKQYN